MNKESLITVIFLFIFPFGIFVYTVNQRDESRAENKALKAQYDELHKTLIDFGHARYTIDPVTGVSKFEIDPVPAKTNSK